MGRRAWQLGWILALVTIVLAAGERAVRAQTLRWQKRGATLREALAVLQAQTGYDVAIHRTGLPAADERRGKAIRRDLAWEDLSLYDAVRQLSAAFQCHFRAVGETRLFLTSPPSPPAASATAGPYRILCSAPISGGEEHLLLSLLVESDSELALEAIAGVGSNWRAIDSLSRNVNLPGRPAAPQEISTLYRRYLTQWQHTVRVELADDSAPRLRELNGELLLYHRVRPLRLEFDLTQGDLPQTRSAEGVEIRLERWIRRGDVFIAETRTTWPGRANLIGRGLSRAISPYLVDADGRIARVSDDETEETTDQHGVNTCVQTLEFDSSAAAPHRLVFDLLLRERPLRTLPFRLQNVPLSPGGRSWRAEPGSLLDPAGGILEAHFLLPPGTPLDGELSVGLSRRLGARWDAWRWLEVALDSRSSIRLEGLRPGRYRLHWRYRVAGQTALQSRAPVSVTLTPRKQTSLTIRAAP